ncbi:MAG: universal stress protein [Thermodesulfobacteriota bacterium]
MVAKKKSTGDYQNILCASDFSDASDAAFAHALAIAKTYKATLYLVHVVDTSLDAGGFYLPHLSLDKYEKDMKKAAGEKIRKYFLRRLKGFTNFEIDVRSGVPHKEILKAVKKSKADLVVMGTYGRSGLDRLVFGSTTERVLRSVKLPVLVAHDMRGGTRKKTTRIV